MENEKKEVKESKILQKIKQEVKNQSLSCPCDDYDVSVYENY